MLQDQLPLLPSSSGVYFFRDAKNDPIYIGKARDLKKRVSSYFSKSSLESKALDITNKAALLDFIVVGSEFEAYLLEASLIKKYQPYFNVKLTDDSSYPYIKISASNLSISITRNRSEQNAEYFGPYPDVKSLKFVLKTIRKVFPFQSVNNHPKRKCLYYHLHMCPCIPVYPEKTAEYRKNVAKIKQLLNGNISFVQKKLEKEKNEFIKSEEFEKAGETQNAIDKLKHITTNYYSPFQYEEKADFYYKRIRQEVESLKKILNQYLVSITKLDRIECYDISNFSGKLATGSMVVFIDGDAKKSEYKRFRIKTKSTPDDFAMMREVFGRRFNNDWENPDLIVVDGGKGQVSAALQVMAAKNIKIPLIGLAKKKEIVIIPQKIGRMLDFIEVDLPNETPGINLLRRLRNEAHRFAITYHRLLRKKNLLLQSY